VPGQILSTVLTVLGGVAAALAVYWVLKTTLHSNSLLLMVMLLWGQAGFSMVLLSAAIKDPRSSDAFPSRQSAPSHRPVFPLLGAWPRSIRLDGIL